MENKLEQVANFSEHLSCVRRLVTCCYANYEPFKGQRTGAVDCQKGDLKRFESLLNALNSADCNDLADVVKDISYTMLTGPVLRDAANFLTVYHNAYTLRQIKDEASLNAVIAEVRGVGSDDSISDFLETLADYSFTYSQSVRRLLLSFLNGKLVHGHEDIRHLAAKVIAQLIYDCRRDIVDDAAKEAYFLNRVKLQVDKFLQRDVTMSNLQSEWIGASLSRFVGALVKKCTAQEIGTCVEAILDSLESYLQDESCSSYIIDTLGALPIEKCNQRCANQINAMLSALITSGDDITRLEVLYLYNALKTRCQYVAIAGLDDVFRRDTAYPIVLNDLYYRINVDDYNRFKGDIDVNAMYLSNLKAATPRVVKLIQIDLLLSAIKAGRVDAFYTAMHFSNILKVSGHMLVRRRAGIALIEVFDQLSNGQKNDIVIELLRSLEIQSYRFAKLVPEVLGALVARLPEVEFYEILLDFSEKVKVFDESVAISILNATALAIRSIGDRVDCTEQLEARIAALLKVMFNGLFHYKPAISQHAIRVFGRSIYRRKLDQRVAALVFKRALKKLLVAMTRESDQFFTHLTKAATLNALSYRLNRYSGEAADQIFAAPQKVAFFPGSYDPFSKAHLKSAVAIRDLGFEVYLAVDEFSWSKRTQPNRIRRKIVEMSIADEYDIYLFGQKYIVNIANRDDLLMLKKTFGKREVYLVMGSDVLTGASAYRREDIKDVINSFSHVLFVRADGMSSTADDAALEKAIANLKGDVIKLALSKEVEHISSTQIRQCIDRKRDISELTEEKSQQYIYDTSLYRHEPRFKDTMTIRSTSVTVVETIDEALLLEISQQFNLDIAELHRLIDDKRRDQELRILLIRDINNDNQLIAYSIFHWLRSGMIYHEFPSDMLSAYIRKHAIGRIVIIDTMMYKPDHHFKHLEQVILTETLAHSLAKDYTYAIYKDAFDNADPTIAQVLRLQGFVDYCDDAGMMIKTVDMTNPITLNLDCKSMIKAPYRNSPVVNAAIEKARRKLQESLCQFKPGHLVLSFDRTMIYEHLIKKICDVNGVSTVEAVPRALGDNMCVTYGNLFKRWRIPNTVTKALHTERFYNDDYRSYEVQNHPNYLDIDIQTRTIKSFQRPVILVDDIIDKGYRLKSILSHFDQEQVEIKKLVVATLSGRGKAWLEMNGIDVAWAYYIPKIKYWFNESMLYPFIGGDAVKRQSAQYGAALSSINLLLPYVFPQFLKDFAGDRMVNFSQTCLSSAKTILQALEAEYLQMYGRGLTLMDLSDVLIAPRLPYKSDFIAYKKNSRPSDIVAADLNYLSKIDHCYGASYE